MDTEPHNDNSKRDYCTHGVSFDEPCFGCEDDQERRCLSLLGADQAAEPTLAELMDARRVTLGARS